MKCENCIEWEYFEGYGYGCFAMRTMTPIDAEKCKFYAYKFKMPPLWKPCVETKGGEQE